MRPTTQGRLMILLTSVVVVFGGGLTIESYLQHRKLDMLLSNGVRERTQFFDKLLMLRGKSLETFVFDYTYWDELVRYVSQRDDRWARENLVTACGTYDVDYIWIYRSDGSLVSTTRSQKVDSLGGPENPVDRDRVQEIFGRRRFCHFFYQSPAGLIEMRGATIHASNDAARTRDAHGFLIAGRLWDASFLKEIGSLAGGIARTIPTGVSLPEPGDSGDYAVSRDLVGFDGEKLAKLVLVGRSPLVPLIKRASVQEFLLTMAFGFLLLGLLHITLTRWVTRPLACISESLTSEDAGHVEPLRGDKTEFGQLATMIHRFFVQREELAHEVSERKRAEEDACALNERLEDRVSERTKELERAKAVLESEIAERRLAEEALLQAKETAEAAGRAKTHFLSTMSHEIRTPMNGILALTELVLATDLEPETREHLRIVRSSADSLLAIINDILDFSKLEADRVHLDSVAFNLRACLTDATAPLAMRASSKGLAFEVEVAPQVPETVIGDPVRLRQILINLVGNGIKFTDAGWVNVSCNVESQTDSNVLIRLGVTDTGVGIPPAKQGIIFDAFAQADPSITRKFGGTGLGLAITKQLVELMGGVIRVESEVGRGSRFVCTMRMGVAGEEASDLPAAA